MLDARARILPPIREKIDAPPRDRPRLDRPAQDVFEWVEPRAGVVCFPRVRDGVPLDPDRFYDSLLGEHGTYVGPGHWFGQDRRSFRLGFAWPRDRRARARARRPQRRRRPAASADR